MSDNEAAEFATAGSGKSPEEVAFELVNKLKGQGVWGERNKDAILDMYAECLDATKGLRVYEGQNRVNTPIKTGVQVQPQAIVPQAQPAPIQAAEPVQPVQSAPPQPVAASPVPVQPVQAQQAHLAQVFKPGA